MKKQRQLFNIIILWGLMLIIGSGCDQEVVAPAPESEASQVLEIPDAVLASRDSAIEFVREAAAICVPPSGVDWQATLETNPATEGATIYRFVNGDCTISVAYPDPEPDEIVYYVSLRNTTTDFCWQAFIDDTGSILSTGYESVPEETVNPAVSYCEAQGYTYKIITKENGEPCPACVFSEEEGAACNIWDFFYGNCGQEE